MHIEVPVVPDIGLSSSTRPPVSARRLSQKVLLVLVSGRMWVRDVDGTRRDITGPTWVVWYPGEALEYGTDGDTVHWVVAQRTAGPPPGLPRPGSLVRVAHESGGDEPAKLVEYLDDSPEQTGVTSVVVDAAGSGIGIYGLSDLLEVLEEADPDLHDRIG